MLSNSPTNSVTQLLAQAHAVLGGGRLEQRACLEEVSALLMGLNNRTGPETVTGGLAAWQLRRVMEHIEQHIDEPITVGALAAMARLSLRHFSRAFARSQGAPPHAYIVVRRVAHAKRLIRSTAMPLSEIALACGACDQAHLSRLFRTACGLSPLQWRRAYGAEPVPTAGRVPGANVGSSMPAS